MLPTLTLEKPIEGPFVFETKYDGFRGIIRINNGIQLLSRNGKDLLKSFPEASEYYNQLGKDLKHFQPLTLDGELCILQNSYKGDFYSLQKRGRLKSEKSIQTAMQTKPATYLAFDILEINGEQVTGKKFLERKKLLENLFITCGLPVSPNPRERSFLQMVPFEKDFQSLWKKIIHYDGEGIVAKHIHSKWEPGKRTNLWLKYKNWKTVHCFITAYEKSNGYFHVAVYKDKIIHSIGLFKNGLGEEEKSTLLKVIRTNKESEDEAFIYIAPAICVELIYLEWYEEQLREPRFSRFLITTSPEDCTFSQFSEKMILACEMTHPDKTLWEKPPILKRDYLSYMYKIYPYMAPFLKNRLLTVIRCPHGIFGETFFQKNCPDYAPDFVETYKDEGIDYIVCNNYETFMWLGNQLAIEFHIPFQTIEQKGPSEIVLDLDPPAKTDFPLAVEAAGIIKEEINDKLGLQAFIKVSGKKGLQIYFPLSENSTITWDDSRHFTKFIADFLLAKNRDHFTIERLKKKRGKRLYIDYVQHAKGKTIIAPFSVRRGENAGVAAPIHWEELHKPLEPDGFSMKTVLERLSKNGNPFANFFQSENDGPLSEILAFLKK